MSGAAETTRIHVIFHGRVQGVFFRATTQEIAAALGLSGYARNLPDGTVEMEAQGTPDQLRRLIDDVLERYAGNVTRHDESATAAVAGETGFKIRY